MRIIFKREEEELDKLLETQHNELTFYKGKVKKLEKKVEVSATNYQNKIEVLEEKLASANGAKGGYTKKINELKDELEEANKILDTDRELIKHLEKQLEEQRSYYSTKLEEANKKIENYKKDALSSRIKPTIQEYDGRLKYRKNEKKK